MSAASADTREIGEEVDDDHVDRLQRYTRKIAANDRGNGGAAGDTERAIRENQKQRDNEVLSEEQQDGDLETGRNGNPTTTRNVIPGTTTNIPPSSSVEAQGRRSARTDIDEDGQVSSELPVVSAWQVTIDENNYGSAGGLDMADPTSLSRIPTTTSTVVPMVEAEKSSEDALRRWNRRLVMVIAIICMLFVIVAIIAVVVSSKNGGGDNDGDNDGDSNDMSMLGPTSSPTKPPLPQNIVQLLQNETWTQRGETLLGNATLIEFGKSVALNEEGNVLAVGAWGGSNWTGRVYIYKFEYDPGQTQEDGRWELISGGTLTGHQEGNQLGVSVDLSDDGNVLAAGENQYNKGDMMNRTGMVRVFRRQAPGSRSPGEWVQVGPDILGISWFEQFGWKVATSSDGKIVAGAARMHANRTGYVRAFRLQKAVDGSDENSTWIPMGSVLYGAVTGDQFGTSLALSGDGMTIASGADENDSAGLNAGHARIFRFNPTLDDWEQLGQTLEAMYSRDDFGYSISLSNDGNTVAVGAYEYNETMGYVHVYKYNGLHDNGGDAEFPPNTWIFKGSTLYGPYSGSQFGISVKLSSDGNTLVVGANEHNFGQQDRTGRAYVYEFVEDDYFHDWLQVGQTLLGDNADDRFGWDVASSRNGKRIAVTAYRSDENGDKSGQAKVFDRE